MEKERHVQKYMVTFLPTIVPINLISVNQASVVNKSIQTEGNFLVNLFSK